MKKLHIRFTPFFLLAMGCAFFSCKQQPQGADVEADIAAVKEVMNKYETAINTGNFDLWISLWTDDGVQMPPETPSRIGKEQIRDAMKPAFDQMNLEIAIHSIDDAKVYGELGVTVCTYTLKMTPKAGGETIDAMPDGKALTIHKKQPDGTWKIAYDCFNASIPMKR